MQRELSLKLNNANGVPDDSLPVQREVCHTKEANLGQSSSCSALAAVSVSGNWRLVFEFEGEKRLTKNEAIVLSKLRCCSSFPRKRESRGLQGRSGCPWTPAFAGATITRSEGRLHVGPAFKPPERRDSEMEMHDPAHPGEIFREECLKPLGLTVTAAPRPLASRARRSRTW